MAFFGSSAYFYWVLPGSAVSGFLDMFQIGLNSRYYGSIAATYGALALIHVGFLLQMTVSSIRRRQFVFALGVLQPVETRSKAGNPVEAARRALLWVYAMLFAPTGLLGVSGPCFDLLLLVREVLETALQTVQAYRMSWFLSRVLFNRFYVGLLVLSCWLTAIAHALFRRTSTTKYFVILLCDFVLDLASSIVIPSFVAFAYAGDVDPDDDTWFGAKWFDDAWTTNASNEFLILLVTSAADLSTRVVFALGMISNFNTLKRIASAAVDPTGAKGWKQRWDAIIPEPQALRRSASFGMTVLTQTNHAVKNNRVLTRLLRTVFALWGLVTLVLHVMADSSPQVPQCAMQVRPWGVLLPSCNLVLVDCHQEQIQGHAGEIHERFRGLHLSSIAVLHARHCPSLEMPAMIQSLTGLTSVKIYNSSITEWGADAALTSAHHPAFLSLRIIRSTVTGGKLPLGLQSEDFPRYASMLVFIHTNLDDLPDDLDLKWPTDAIVHFDTAQFTHIPDVLLRLKPHTFQLAGNPLTDVPKELFTLSGPEYLDLRDTYISSLPEDVESPLGTLNLMNLDRTNVSSFPAWMNEWLLLPGNPVFSERVSAADSPYCLEREQIFDGVRDGFSAVAGPQSSDSRLMDASRDNWSFLARTVACSPSSMYRYLLELEDMLSGWP